MLPVAILAGGLATRLRPMANETPKALIVVTGRPFIVHQLELLHAAGIDRTVLCVGHLGERIREVVGDGRKFGIVVEYSFDGDALLGTGGAVRQALPMLGENFFVLHGDSYLRCSFAQVQAAYQQSRHPALMTVLRNDNRWDRSNVTFVDGKLIAYNKKAPRSDMQYIDYGLSVFSRDVFVRCPDQDPIDLADICANLSERGELAGLEVFERFYEIGSLAGLRDTEAYLSQGGRRQ